eukprot:CAMPEP_0119040160 /NCGR_PEP_ID=MMETSP1177-20130426/10002_1 /TAXON_ID=2985 /ORGANISM="Ochromonas sp, Strain CCMP1899" /LENGTH=917 /DNA_ID=CAMNT_0007004925 /DNA_START=408 /DNA_END=3161 /DNA_ORIENTATION=-
MIWVAAIIEVAIGNYPDFGILIAIQLINAGLGFYEVVKAGDAVAALKSSLKPLATAKRDGIWKNIDATTVVPHDLVLLASGSAVPADCIVNHGQIEVDQAALTGESLPVTMHKGDQCKMGSTVVRGEVEGTVEFTGSNTFFGKTASLLQGTGESGSLQKILLRIMIILVAMSLVLSGIVLIFLLVSDVSLKESISFTVVLIVASIPIAIEIVVTTTLALGSKELSKMGAIVTRLAAIEDMAGMNMLCSDKTGTLTMNKMMIQEATPIYSKGESQYSILRYAAMAAKWKEPPRDALDSLTLIQADLASLEHIEQLDFMPFDPIMKRTEASLKDLKTGEEYKTTKGAPHVIMGLTKDEAIKAACEADVHDLGKRGIRSLAIARTNAEGEWELLGLLTFLDPPRHDTKETIRRAILYGVDVKMITGDHLLIAVETARQLELGERVFGSDMVVPNIKNADGLPLLDPETKKPPKDMVATYGDYIRTGHGFAQVFPEHKYLIVECLRQIGYRVGMTGDGVNDAPALKRADVGVAVSGSTDAARAAADIVLTQEGLSTIVDGILISRQIFQRIQNFITYRIAATLQLLIFFFIAVFSLKPIDYMPDNWEELPGFDISGEWPSFFQMPVLMLMLITLLNDGTLISVGYDNVKASPLPGTWNLYKVFTMSSLLAGVALLSSLIILFLCLNSWDPNSVMHAFGLGQLSYGQIITVVYLKVSVSDFLTLFSARTPEGFFWTTAPSWILFCASVFALSLSTVVACAWPSSYPDGIYALGLGYRHPKSLALFVWVYCIFWWFVQDFLKVCLHKYMERYGIFGMIKNEQAHQLDARKNRNAKDKYTDKGSRMDVGAERNEDALEGGGNESRNPLFNKSDYKPSRKHDYHDDSHDVETNGTEIDNRKTKKQEERRVPEDVENKEQDDICLL